MSTLKLQAKYTESLETITTFTKKLPVTKELLYIGQLFKKIKHTSLTFCLRHALTKANLN